MNAMIALKLCLLFIQIIFVLMAAVCPVPTLLQMRARMAPMCQKEQP